MTGLLRITAPDDGPVTLAEAKLHLRIDSTDEDTLIRALISAATENVDGPRGYLGRALLTQTWDYYLDGFCYNPSRVYHPSYIEIPLTPLRSVTGVYYRDSAGNEQTLSASSYTVDTASEPGRIYSITAWPSSQLSYNTVRIRFVAGYVDDEVPFPIKAAILIHIADLYEQRESMNGANMALLPWSAQQLLKPHRMHRGFA